MRDRLILRRIRTVLLAIACPVLIVASRSDEIIPFSSSVRLSGLFLGDVDFMTLDNTGHNFIFSADGVFDSVQAFLEDLR